MANVSVPKVLFGIIYFLIPILCWFVTPVHDLFPEEWMIAAVVAVMFLLGFFFLLRKSNLVFEILAIVCLIASLVFTGYLAYPTIKEDFAQVDTDYENESGNYYSPDDTVFQEKQQVLAFDAISQIPNAIKYAWGAMGILLVVFGLYSCKEIISYAMIPANKSTKFNPNEEIPENVEASTNRPTAEQRAQALAQMHATGGTSDDGPAPYEPKSNDAEPDWNLNVGGAPVIKTPTEVNQGSSSSMAPDPKKNAEPAVTYDGRVNINLDLGEDFVPKVTVEQDNSYADINQMPENKQENKAKAETVKPAAEPEIIDMEEPAKPQPAQTTQNANPFATMGNLFDSAPQAQPTQPTKAAEQPQSQKPAENPFATMGNLFDNTPKTQPVQPTKAAEQPQSQKPAENPFATMGSLFDDTSKAQPAKTVAPAPAPAPAAEPVKTETVEAPKVVLTPVAEPVKTEKPATAPKVILTPEPSPINTEAAAAPKKEAAPTVPVAPVTNVSSEPMTQGVTFRMPEGPKEAPKPAVPKSKMDPAEKARIRELNAQVAELKTLYNQGMITQEEYVAQRTELLQQMYNHS